MANIKITDLTAYTDAASTDVLPIVDVGADVTKKIAIGDIVKAVPQGTAALPGLAFDGDPNTGVYSPGADQVAISTNGIGRLFVDSTGKVGIGTPNSTATLHVRAADSDTVATLLRLEQFNAAQTDSARLVITADVANNLVTYDATGFNTGSHVFLTGGIDRARIDSSGRLLVGTSTGTAPLTVAGTNIEVRSTNGAYINNSQTTSVSTSATTIVNNAGFQGRLWVINGATGGDRFCDLVMASTGAAPVVVQSFTAIGSPAARTYTRSGSALQLAMASGTYDVRCIRMGA